MKFSTIPEALSAIKAGEIIIVVDEPDRENEGDLIMASGKGYSRIHQLYGKTRARVDLSSHLFRKTQ